MRPLAEFHAALCLLTRLPLGSIGSAHGPVPIERAVWAFPLAGGLAGLAGSAVYAICSLAHMPPFVAAAWCLAAMLLLTGGLHEDGLADTADGFGGGRTRERKLEIMRDSRLGSFGAVALLLSLGVRGAAIAALGEPRRVLPALVVSGAVGRAVLVVPLLMLVPARDDGLAVGLRGLGISQALVALAIAVVVAIVLVPPAMTLAAIASAVAVSVVLARIAVRQIGGYTGDVLGATEVIAECAILSALSANPGGG